MKRFLLLVILGLLMGLIGCAVNGSTTAPAVPPPATVTPTPAMATPTVTNTPVTGGTITIQWKEPGPSYCSFNVVADSGESFYYSLPVAISPPLAGATVWYNVAPGSRIFYISGYPVTETVAPSGNYYLAVTISCTANPGIGWN